MSSPILAGIGAASTSSRASFAAASSASLLSTSSPLNFENPFLEFRLDQEPAKCLGRHHEGLGHGQTERGHLAEAGPLAADRRDVLFADLLEHQGIRYILWNAAQCRTSQ